MAGRASTAMSNPARAKAVVTTARAPKRATQATGKGGSKKITETNPKSKAGTSLTSYTPAAAALQTKAQKAIAAGKAAKYTT